MGARAIFHTGFGGVRGHGSVKFAPDAVAGELELPAGSWILVLLTRYVHQSLRYIPHAISTHFNSAFSIQYKNHPRVHQTKRSYVLREGTGAPGGHQNRSRYADRAMASVPVCALLLMDVTTTDNEATLATQTARDPVTRKQRKHQAEDESPDVRPPHIGAIAGAGIAEEQL